MWAYVAAVGGEVIKVPALGLKGGDVLSFRTWKPEDPKRCPMCRVVGVAADFEKTEVGCEDCGDHPALRCRRCGESIDMIYRNEADFDP